MDKDVFKQIILPLLGVAAFIIIVGFYTKGQRRSIGIVSSPTPTRQETVKIGDLEIKITKADTEAERKKGLSGVSPLRDGEGMLFVFEKKDVTPSFWMKDMKIAIDIIWINEDVITQIDKNVRPPRAGTKDSDLVIYKPKEPIDYVLEVSAGFSDKNNIKVGDSVR